MLIKTFQIKRKNDRFVSKEFLTYIRSLQCCVCEARCERQKSNTCPSHLYSSKYADGSDALAVPACISPRCHPQSTRSAREIVEKHIVDVPELHVRLWNGFLEEQGINVRVSTQAEFERLLSEYGLTEKAYTRRKNR